MRIEYDPNLIEKTVFLAARGNGRLEAELHAATDAVYAVPDAGARSARFQEVHAAFFERWKLGDAVADLIGARPLIAEHVGLCIVRWAARRRDESADLYARRTNGDGAPPGQTLIIQSCPEALLDRDRLGRWLGGELLHVSDMLDPRFEYRRETFEGPLAKQNLTRDRYRVLWEVYVQGRLERDDKRTGDVGRLGRIRANWDRAFGLRGDRSCAAFDRVFCGAGLTHGQLMEWAARPGSLLDEGSETSRSPGPRPGEPCPLCGFPTHDWYVFRANDLGTLVEAVRLRHPDWAPENGACRQCAEIYASAAAAETVT